ncbi:MAG: Na+/H+ antiporter NhaA [Anaerolineae bacterium]|nr:Na+/H+ antiporter NhaA [Anaerolineae bacterium]
MEQERDSQHPQPVPSCPPAPIERILRPFENFVHQQASGGIVLLACAAVALLWANSPWSSAYESVWRTPLSIRLGALSLEKPLLLWINDGLMAIFFFVIGLEIKREVLVGELASVREAALPIAAALGGMLAPAAIFIALNAGRPSASGWGIPMATDIAFALGILTLLGRRAPISLKVFLTALAIADDLGAVMVIALFYTTEIAWGALAVAAAVVAVLLLMNRLGVRSALVYGMFGLVLWLAVLKSGVHATIAGVLLAMVIPARARITNEVFIAQSREILSQFEQACAFDPQPLGNKARAEALLALETAARKAEAPLQRLEHSLHSWAAFVIMPVFALANAGVALGESGAAGFTHPTAMGIALGLVLGKPLGIVLFAWLAVRVRLARLPADVDWRQIVGVGFLAGIGFTMSLFIANLSFRGTPLLDIAKTGILAGSFVAGVVGWAILHFVARERQPAQERTG